MAQTMYAHVNKCIKKIIIIINLKIQRNVKRVKISRCRLSISMNAGKLSIIPMLSLVMFKSLSDLQSVSLPLIL
jgi:hypothetical protein